MVDWLSIAMRALITGVLLSQAACSTCETHSPPATNSAEASKYDSLLIARTPQKNSKQSAKRPRTLERVELSLRDGTKHSAILSFPEKTRTRLPAVIVLGGFEAGEKAMGFLKEDLDVVYATTDYPYKAPNQRGFLKSLQEISVISRAIRRADLAVDALIETLRTDPRIDLTKLTFVGASFGAPFAITAAVRHPELDGLLLIHAFGRVDAAIAQQLKNKWGWWSAPLAWYLGHFVWDLLDYKAPEDEVKKLHPHQQVFYIYSDADEQLPCKSVTSLLNALKKSPAQVTTAKSEGGHVGPGKIDMIDGLMDVSLEWLKEHGLL